jgi:hypothetical protein
LSKVTGFNIRVFIWQAIVKGRSVFSEWPFFLNQFFTNSCLSKDFFLKIDKKYFLVGLLVFIFDNDDIIKSIPWILFLLLFCREAGNAFVEQVIKKRINIKESRLKRPGFLF